MNVILSACEESLIVSVQMARRWTNGQRSFAALRMTSRFMIYEMACGRPRLGRYAIANGIVMEGGVLAQLEPAAFVLVGARYGIALIRAEILP